MYYSAREGIVLDTQIVVEQLVNAGVEILGDPIVDINYNVHVPICILDLLHNNKCWDWNFTVIHIPGREENVFCVCRRQLCRNTQLLEGDGYAFNTTHFTVHEEAMRYARYVNDFFKTDGFQTPVPDMEMVNEYCHYYQEYELEDVFRVLVDAYNEYLEWESREETEHSNNLKILSEVEAEQEEERIAQWKKDFQVGFNKERMALRKKVIEEMKKKWEQEKKDSYNTYGGWINFRKPVQKFETVRFLSGPHRGEKAVYIGNGLRDYPEFHWGEYKTGHYQCWNNNRSRHDVNNRHYYWSSLCGVFFDRYDVEPCRYEYSEPEVLEGIMKYVRDVSGNIYTRDRQTSLTDAVQFLDGCFFDKHAVVDEINEILIDDLERLPELFRSIVQTRDESHRQGTAKRWMHDFLHASYVRTISYNYRGDEFVEMVKSNIPLFELEDEWSLTSQEKKKFLKAV